MIHERHMDENLVPFSLNWAENMMVYYLSYYLLCNMMVYYQIILHIILQNELCSFLESKLLGGGKPSSKVSTVILLC